MKKLFCIAILTLLFALALTSRAQARVTTNEKIPVSGLSFHDCPPGETVSFEGFAHMVVREGSDATGGFHQNFHFNFQGVEGVGLTTGDRYTFKNNFNLVATVPSGEFRQFTISQNVSVIRQGSDDNLVLHVLTKLTVNSNGTATAEFVNFSMECLA